MKRVLFCLMVVCVYFAVADNLLLNGNLERKENNFFALWQAPQDAVTFLKGGGHDGKNAVQVDFKKTEYFRQRELTLVAGEMYRMGAWVKTKNFKAYKAAVATWDYGPWANEVTVGLLPENTDGWVHITKEFKMRYSSSGVYASGIYVIGYVSGEVQISDMYLEPLTEKAKAGSKGSVFVFSNRIVPHTPLLSRIPSGWTDFSFQKAQEPEPGMKAKLRIEYADGRKLDSEIPYVNTFFTFKVPALLPGSGKLHVEIVKDAKAIAANDYLFTVLEPAPKDTRKGNPQPMKRLNNMVVELYSGRLENGTVEIFNPREGWVFIGFDKPSASAKAYLDGQASPILTVLPGEAPETMRYLDAGMHSIQIKDATAGNIAIRAIPFLYTYPLFMPPKTNYSTFVYDLDFYKKYLFHTVNFFNCENTYSRECRKELEARGNWFLGCGAPPRKMWFDADKMVKELQASWAIKDTPGLTIDELPTGSSQQTTIGLAEALWRLQDSEKLYFTWVCGGKFYVPEDDAEIYSGITNTSRGRGKLMYETYICTRPTEEDALTYLNSYRSYMTDAAKLGCDPQNHIMMIITALATIGDYTCFTHPEVDLKYFFDLYFQILSTAPEFKDLCGFGNYNNYHVDEEVTRWIARCMHYYGIEGGTELLSKKYGFKYIPGHFTNGDFVKGFDSWNAAPADGDSLKAEKLVNYSAMQHRINSVKYKKDGDYFALFTRSAKGPNRLSQKAINLVPGKLYTLGFTVADWDDVHSKEHNSGVEPFLKYTIDNAEIVPELSFIHKLYEQKKHWKGTRFNTGRILFRAKAKEVTITFSDWDNDTTPGGKIGQKQMLNFVHVKPYFEE